jgi:Mrp family chromosome partitioning ATPase
LVALGLLLGFVLATAIALALERSDRRLKDESAVEQAFELPVLGVIPRARSVGAALAAIHPTAFGLLAGALPLGGPGSSVIMLTSAGGGDGKSTVTLGLAHATSELGLATVVVEADLRRPVFARYADLPPGAGGLVGVLQQPETLEDELVWVDADEDRRRPFGLLPAGASPLNPQRALASAAMAEVIERLREQVDVVLIDTPALGTVNDAATLVAHVDAVIMVARLNHTRLDTVARTMRLLRRLPVYLDAQSERRAHEPLGGSSRAAAAGAFVPGVVITDAPLVSPREVDLIDAVAANGR